MNNRSSLVDASGPQLPPNQRIYVRHGLHLPYVTVMFFGCVPVFSHCYCCPGHYFPSPAFFVGHRFALLHRPRMSFVMLDSLPRQQCFYYDKRKYSVPTVVRKGENTAQEQLPTQVPR